MSEGEVTSAKSRILNVLSEIDDNEVESLERWICSQAYKKDLEQKKTIQNFEKTLKNISNAIKKIVPFEAELSTEHIVPPTVGDQADCNNVNTCHVDEFLYDEQEEEEMVKAGKLKNRYCLDCNSRNVKDLIFISHSLSRQVLQYLFRVLLPEDLEEKQILDVGSRLGAVLYAAYHLTNASTIVGIEMNEECCEIQKKMINQFSMDNNRIKVIHADVMDKSDIVVASDIIIINVLDFFVNIEKHREMWFFFKKCIKKGSYLVLNRSIAETLGSLEIFEDFRNWLCICKPCQLENEIFFDVEDCHKLYLYTIN